jgi:hypothetical protein
MENKAKRADRCNVIRCWITETHLRHCREKLNIIRPTMNQAGINSVHAVHTKV